MNTDIRDITYRVDGLTCEHCRVAATAAVAGIAGVEAVDAVIAEGYEVAS